MMYKKTIIKSIVLGLCLAGSIQAQDSNIRIAWDKRTFQELKSYTVKDDGYVGKNSHYSRIKRLSNGDLLLIYMDGKFGWNIYSRKSKDNGLTWSDAVVVRKSYKDTSKNDNICYACPDFIELPDGQILVAYQWRYNTGYSDPENTNKNCGIETIRSLNMGDSFIAASVKKAYWGRNWEPSFILLPTGELQMFFTDTHTLECNAGLIRSFDNGNTWIPATSQNFTDCEYISRTVENGKTFDGMVVGQYLDNNNGIAIALECDGGTKTPWIVRTSAEDNWRHPDFSYPMAGPGPERKKLLYEGFRGFAPYMAKLPGGEIVVQSNGKFTGESSDKMWVFIGDDNADNFSYASSPHASWWGSISYIGDDEMISTGNAGYKDGGTDYQMLRVIKGKINRAMDIKKGDVQIQPLITFDRSVNNDWFIGGESQAQAYMHMKYASECLNIATHVFDEKLNHYSDMNCDGIQLLINRAIDNTESQYRFTLNIDGKVKIEKQNAGNGYDNIPTSAISEVNVEGTIGNNDDTDIGFTSKTSIPWDLIGGLPQKEEIVRVHLIQKNNDKSSSILPATTESMPGELIGKPLTWMKVTFEGLSGVGISDIYKENLRIYGSANGVISISGDDNVLSSIHKIRIYNIDGSLIKETPFNKENEIIIENLAKGIYIISLFTNEKIISEKVSVY